MKTIILIQLLICSLALSQWQPDMRLTNDTAYSVTSSNNAWSIASSGNTLHVVWQDFRDGNDEIYYKRSTDAGVSWGTDTRLTNNSADSRYPSVAVSGSNTHVVWYDLRNGNEEIYYKRSTDGGVSWGADTRLTNNSASSGYPSVTVSGSNIHVVWEDDRDGNWEIYYKRSTDVGVSWGADTRLTTNSANSWNSSVTVSGSNIHAVWFDDRNGNFEIYYKRSTDGGINWGADTRLTNNSANSAFPSVTVSGSNVHAVWEDNRDGNDEIYYKRSTDGGAGWSADTRLTNNSASSWSPSVTVSGTNIHVVWFDDRDVNFEIYYKRSTDGGVNWGADTRLTNNSASSWYPSVTVSGSYIHVVWYDDRDGNWEIYYKRDPTGNPIGIKTISSEIPEKFSLSQNYPNPFNPVTKINFSIPQYEMPNSSCTTRLIIYDALGKEVAVLVNQQLQPGIYEVYWDASGGTSAYTSGVYYYRLESEKYTETKKMVLVK